MKKFKALFLNENFMRVWLAVSLLCGITSLAMLFLSREATLFGCFEKLVRMFATVMLWVGFSRFRWDAVKGLMGSLLFCLMYEEGLLVLGDLWGGTADFDAYLAVGIQGSLFLAAETAGFAMTLLITLNHYIIDLSPHGNMGNVMFNQIAIIFKVLIYVSLMIVNPMLDLTNAYMLNKGFEYLSDLAMIIILVCVETQINDFKALRHELMSKKRSRQRHE